MYRSQTGSKRPPTDEELTGIFKELDRMLCDSETPLMSASIEDFKKELLHTSNKLKKDFDKHDCYVCEVCDKDFKSKHRFDQHMDNHIQTYRCHYCRKHFQTAADLKKHLTEHEKKVYSCKHCSKTYEFKQQLTVHLKKHVQQTRTFTCQFCKLNKVFSTERELNKHISKKHKHCCKDCMKNFMTKIGLETHRVRNHGAYEQFNCGICKRRFEDCVCLAPLLLETCIHNTPKNLMNIIGSVADSECSRVVNQFLETKQHRLQSSTFKTHRKPKITPKITCKRCYKSFTTSKLYKQHRRLMGCKKSDLYKRFKQLQLQDEKQNATQTSDSSQAMNTQTVTGNTVGCDKNSQQGTEMGCEFEESSELEESCDAQEETDSSTVTP